VIPIGQPLILFQWRALGASRLGDYSSLPGAKIAVNMQMHQTWTGKAACSNSPKPSWLDFMPRRLLQSRVGQEPKSHPMC
jgi:hypothetical protein